MFSNKLFNSCSLSCCLFFVTILRATAVSFLRLVFTPLQFISHLVFLFIAVTGCPDVDLEVLATAQNHLLNLTKAKRCRINLFKRHRFAIANFEYARLVALKLATVLPHFQLVHIVPAGSIRSSWFNTFLLVVLAPWCTSRFIIPFDVPAGPPSTLALAAGSTWPPPDYEQLTQLWTSPLLIQLPYTMMNQTYC
ncbi:Nodulation receptor kinase precursor [Dorcoceras hygrometricum]|uniref:Nodulation receptor kinase n=1 Tax=Dorcoceras hygrometricum TaxID=472368 RepID=A0A2Z7AHJ5_9LAMI|nr:Nodulation receptor kinase precursor [Dorcoceras hygrometricum]